MINVVRELVPIIVGAAVLAALDWAVRRYVKQPSGSSLTTTSPKVVGVIQKARVSAGLAIQKGAWSLAGVGRTVGKRVAGT